MLPQILLLGWRGQQHIPVLVAVLLLFVSQDAAATWMALGTVVGKRAAVCQSA